MRAAGRAGLYLLLCGALLAAAHAPAAQASVQRELSLLRHEEAVLQRRLDRTLRHRDRTINALRLAEDAVAHESARLGGLKARAARDQERLARLRARQAALQARLGRQRVALRRQIVAAYMTGRAGGLEIFLSQEQPTTIDRLLTYYRFVVRARLGVVHAVERVLAQAQQAARATALAQQRLARLAAHLTRQKARLEPALTRRRAVLARLDGRVRSGHAQLLAMRARARRLKRLLAGLRRLPHLRPPVPNLHGAFVAYRGRLPLPLRTTYGAIRLEQGPRGLQRWAGVFMPGRPGQTVYAVFSGRVVYANWLRGYGLLLILQNGDGYMTLYGHCQSLLGRVGDYVHGGQPIATVGNSGGFGRAGLYFDISHDGRPVNPLTWLAR